jgi:ribosome biogenesis GTPase
MKLSKFVHGAGPPGRHTATPPHQTRTYRQTPFSKESRRFFTRSTRRSIFSGAGRVDRSRFLIARVTEEQRGRRAAGEFDGWAEVSGRFRHEAESSAAFPVVGDWVCLSAERADGPGIIHRRLARRGTVARKAAGRTSDEQVMAANVDTIFLVTALADDLSPRRLERYLTMVWEAGARPVVVLNKADLADDPASTVAAATRLALDDVVALSAIFDEGISAGAVLLPATTIALLGSSGVGSPRS